MKTTYTIKYQTDTGRTVERHLVETFNGWLLKDENHHNIRSFSTVVNAMFWIDEERKGI